MRTTIGAQHRSSPHQPWTLLVLTGMLTGVNFIALLSLGLPVRGTHIPRRQGSSARPLPPFYAGANEMPRGQEPAALEHVVASDLPTIDRGNPPGDRADLVRRLMDLRLAAPGVQLRVVAIVEEGAWAAALAAPLGLRPMVHGVSLDPAADSPVQLDFFRVIDEQIVEYWSDESAIDVPHALPSIAATPW